MILFSAFEDDLLRVRSRRRRARKGQAAMFRIFLSGTTMNFHGGLPPPLPVLDERLIEFEQA